MKGPAGHNPTASAPTSLLLWLAVLLSVSSRCTFVTPAHGCHALLTTLPPHCLDCSSCPDPQDHLSMIATLFFQAGRLASLTAHLFAQQHNAHACPLLRSIDAELRLSINFVLATASTCGCNQQGSALVEGRTDACDD